MATEVSQSGWSLYINPREGLSLTTPITARRNPQSLHIAMDLPNSNGNDLIIPPAVLETAESLFQQALKLCEPGPTENKPAALRILSGIIGFHPYPARRIVLLSQLLFDACVRIATGLGKKVRAVKNGIKLLGLTPYSASSTGLRGRRTNSSQSKLGCGSLQDVVACGSAARKICSSW